MYGSVVDLLDGRSRLSLALYVRRAWDTIAS